MNSSQYVGAVPGKAGQTLAKLEEQLAALEAEHRKLQRELQDAQQGAARADQELQRLEAADMAGRPVGRELTAARKENAQADARASEPWARRISVVADAVKLKQRERDELVRDQFSELDRPLLAGFERAGEESREAMREVLAAEDRQNQLASQRSKLAQIAGRDTKSIRYVESPLRNDIRRLLQAA